MPYDLFKVWDEITYPFWNFNSAAIDFWEYVSNFIPYFTGHVNTYPYYNQRYAMLKKGAPDQQQVIQNHQQP